MASKPPDKKIIDDFVVNNIAKLTTKEDFNSLHDKVRKLEDRVLTSENIADTLCEASQKASRMQEFLATTFIKLLKSDEQTKAIILEVIETSDRNWFIKALRRVGVLAWGAFVFILGVLVKIAFDKWFQLRP